MKRIYILFLLLLTMALSAFSRLSVSLDGTAEKSSEIAVTDLLGRNIKLPEPAKKVVAIGPGALRLYVYAGNLDFVVGVEEMEKGDISGKPYMHANPDLAKLPTIGQGGPNNAPDPEKLISVEPDVIFTTYATDAASADELQAKTGIPVVVISYGGAGVTTIFGEKIQKSLTVIGEVTGDTTKADKANSFIKSMKEDLDNRTKDIDDAKKPSIYVGGLGSKGTHGIESTQGKYALLDIIHAKNVVDETGKSGSIMIDKEKLLEWDPDFLFIDQGGFSAVQEDYKKNPDFYNSLKAVKKEKVFSQLPYNYYSTNIDTAIADAFFLGKTIYPDAFKDVEPDKKADEIYHALLGKALYSVMVEKFGGFGKISLK
ncbi:MAG: iron ABC transporter substrate-binding protein [Leptolinea sp.]|jgi:iron complex transport system substrate-binding protein|nr:iron ABC transporter substrate-binding protein [Leptolinea sp.]